MSEANGCMSRESILAYDDGYIEKVDVPEWGDGHVYVRVLPSDERDSFEAQIAREKESTGDISLMNFRARFSVLALVDSDGKRIFSNEDASLLGKKSSSALSRIYNLAAKLNGLTEDDEKELVKNL